MKPITIIAICVICAATLMSGCIEQAEDPRVVYVESEPEIRYVYTPPTPAPTSAAVEPTHEYTKIWSYTTVAMKYFDDNHNLLNVVSEPTEITAPYTEYLWTDDGESLLPTVELMFAGTGYTDIHTDEERGEYVTDDTYTYHAEFEVDYPPDMGYVLVYIDTICVRS